MRLVLLVVLVACHHDVAPAVEPPSPHRAAVAPAAPPPPPPTLEVATEALAAGLGTPDDRPALLDVDPLADLDDGPPLRGALVIGEITDSGTGEPLPGVTVIVSLADHSEAAITDERGRYRIVDLPAGWASIAFYYNTTTISREVTLGERSITSIDEEVDPTTGPPAIDPSSTAYGITIDRNYVRDVPVPGRTFESVLGVAAGSQEDSIGELDDQAVSFTGVTSLENTYIIDSD